MASYEVDFVIEGTDIVQGIDRVDAEMNVKEYIKDLILEYPELTGYEIIDVKEIKSEDA